MASWSRARAMCWPVSRNHSRSLSLPDSAREAYFCTSGPAWKESLEASTRMSSTRAGYSRSPRNDSSADWEPLFRAVLPSRLTALPPTAITVVVATRKSSIRADLYPPAR